MTTFHNFKDVASFQKFLQSGKYPACHSSGCLDYVKVANVIYTMHEYDLDGQSVTWANKKQAMMIEMTTANRYKLGYNDAEVVRYPASFLRNDISYAE